MQYQSGYLTIRHFTPITHRYRLAYPNKDVKIGMLKSLAPNYLSPVSVDNNGLIGDFIELLYDEKLEEALLHRILAVCNFKWARMLCVLSIVSLNIIFSKTFWLKSFVVSIIIAKFVGS